MSGVRQRITVVTTFRNSSKNSLERRSGTYRSSRKRNILYFQHHIFLADSLHNLSAWPLHNNVTMPPLMLYVVPSNGWTAIFSWLSANSAIKFCRFEDWKYLATAAKGTDNHWFTLDSIQSVTGTKRQRSTPSVKNNLHGLYQSLVLEMALDYVTIRPRPTCV